MADSSHAHSQQQSPPNAGSDSQDTDNHGHVYPPPQPLPQPGTVGDATEPTQAFDYQSQQYGSVIDPATLFAQQQYYFAQQASQAGNPSVNSQQAYYAPHPLQQPGWPADPAAINTQLYWQQQLSSSHLAAYSQYNPPYDQQSAPDSIQEVQSPDPQHKQQPLLTSEHVTPRQMPSTQADPQPVVKKSGMRWRRFWPWGKDYMQKFEDNLKDKLSGKSGHKAFRRIYFPSQPGNSQGNGIDVSGESMVVYRIGTAEAEDIDGLGKVHKIDGKLTYVNQFHQRTRKFLDVAVYLSPTRFTPRRLIVQATDHVIKTRSDRGGDWIRTKVRGSVPLVLAMSEWALFPFKTQGFWAKTKGTFRLFVVAIPLQVLLALPFLGDYDNDDEVTDTYTDYPGYYWSWPKYAVNELDMSPVSRETRSEGYKLSLDVTKRASRPRLLYAKVNGEWTIIRGDTYENSARRYIFISYMWRMFPDADGAVKAHNLARRIVEHEGFDAYWMDRELVNKDSGADTDYDVYTLCDTVRGSSKVCLMMDRDGTTQRLDWGSRMWTLMEGLLAPGNITYCFLDAEGRLVTKEIGKVEMTASFWRVPPHIEYTDNMEAVRILAEHYANVLTLSRLELLPATITALSTKDRTEFTGSDLAYAVMGFLHYRIERQDEWTTVFQNLARLSLGNDSDELVERMLCLLPKPSTKDIFETLSERDEYRTFLHQIKPQCQVVGVAHEDETVILDSCRAIHIRWKDFPRATVQRDVGFGKVLAVFFLAFGIWWLTFGIQMSLGYIPYFAGLVTLADKQNGRSYVGWVIAGFFFVGLLLSAPSPFSVRRLYGGTVLKSTPNLVGFEGVMPIAQLEKIIFGNVEGRLTYAPSATPFSREHRENYERRGREPDWIDNPDSALNDLKDKKLLPSDRHQLFTLVDMGELTVTIFAAERPPTVALLCGKEGGMLRAVLCSWRFETDCLYRETVVRMPTRVWEVAEPKGWLKLCLRSQDEYRRREPVKKEEKRKRDKKQEDARLKREAEEAAQKEAGGAVKKTA
ncbi:hypothetical protein QBC32DRAFT_310826 [Pseudoneurospora amorphoporcata]|uniref:3-hydroxyisobutyrate dehydrogenase protein n=1 Tax=Pseudoneurospora amorphoporcata TaxID=241081 RepID=A0AAN6P4X7_9PEZI|nr:hypothetical protein QBC32DRAFT_310826 [Pseudoneurospora amorphoporcata]